MPTQWSRKTEQESTHREICTMKSSRGHFAQVDFFGEEVVNPKPKILASTLKLFDTFRSKHMYAKICLRSLNLGTCHLDTIRPWLQPLSWVVYLETSTAMQPIKEVLTMGT